MSRPRKSGHPHKGWKKALYKMANGPLRTATAYREVAKSALEDNETDMEENETSNEYVSDNGQFGAGA